MDDDATAEGLLDRIRDMPVGTRDPNIIGDAGPLDVPPGADPTDSETEVDAAGSTRRPAAGQTPDDGESGPNEA